LHAIQVSLEFDCDDDSPDLVSLRNETKIQEALYYHPNVVRCYKSFRKEDSFYILMEYVGHQTLDDLTLPLVRQPQIVNLIIQICMGLKHLKNNHIIHRDIKPNNILISDKGLLKIGDFGVSKLVTPSNGGKTCLGTPYYSAP
jgi:serine/threonine protein kinase